MAETTKPIRLSKAAKEFNVGISTIVEFLAKKGTDISASPNTKLSPDTYQLLEKEFQSLNKDKMVEGLFKEVREYYKKKNERIREQSMPVIRDVFENNSQYDNIAIPITDGSKEMQVIANLKKAVENDGQEVILAIEKGVTLRHIDNAWKEHLRELDDLKQSVQNATYEQKDPLLVL